jgi:hypothetical protein
VPLSYVSAPPIPLCAGCEPSLKFGATCQAVSWGVLLRCFGRKGFKSLIYKGFRVNPEILWITLLISTVEWLRRRMDQGLEQTALKKCTPRILYKSITYERLKFLEMR